MFQKASTLRESKKRSKLFLQWMFSYMSILIIPIIICSIYYSHTFKVIKRETIVRQYLSLENVKTQIDNNLKDLIQISTNLQMNQRVSSLSYKTNSSSEIHLQINNLQDELSIFMVTNSFIKEIYIYFPNSDYIVSASNVYRSEFSSFMPSRYISNETWNYLKSKLHKNSYQLILADQNDLKLLFSMPLIINNKEKNPLSIIVFELDKSNFNQLLESQLLSNNFSSLALLNHASVLLSTDSELTEHLKVVDASPDYTDTGSTEPVSVIQLSEEQKLHYIIDSVDLLLPDLKLVSLTEESLYYNEASNILVILLIALFTSILVGSIITFFYSVHNYRPLKEIMGYLKTSPFDLGEKNEYGKIKEMIIRTNSEIKMQRNLIKNNYLYKLLTGEIQLSQVSGGIAEQFCLNFRSDFSYVVLLRFSFFNLYPEDSLSKEWKDPKNDLAFFITQNILSELFQPFFPHLHFCHSQTETAMIVNISDDSEKNEDILSDGLGTFIEYCRNHFEINFYVGVSSLCDTNHLSDAYTQANNTLEYMHLFGIGNLHYYKDTPKESQISYLDLKTSDYIINLVMSASEHSLEDYFNNICQQLKQRKLSSEDAKSCLYFFYNVFMRLKTRLQHQFPYKTLEGLFVLDSQFFTCSLLEAIKYIEKPFTQAALMVKEQSSNNLDKKIHEVTQYIESNYLDINLNLNNIAAHFNITPSYLSKKFREEHGISIIDYLYKVRISYSVDLIRNTSLKITDIAPMVGFQDSNAFIRIFKKYHGCTPGNYKSTVLKSED